MAHQRSRKERKALATRKRSKAAKIASRNAKIHQMRKIARMANAMVQASGRTRHE